MKNILLSIILTLGYSALGECALNFGGPQGLDSGDEADSNEPESPDSGEDSDLSIFSR